MCAGDIFDTWRPPPELINFAIKHVPKGMLAIPGQHDLPLHNYEDIRKSAYWTLVEAGVIEDMGPVSGNKYADDDRNLMVHAFPWGSEIKPDPPMMDKYPNYIHLAAVHAYIWIDDRSYPGAPEEKKASAYRKSLKGYDAAVFGDNHISFTCQSGDCLVFNCGGFMRRRSDEREHKPRVGLLARDGQIKSYYLNVEDDAMLKGTEKVDPVVVERLEDFVSSLSGLTNAVVDFSTAIAQFCDIHNVPKSIREAIASALDRS